MGKLWDKLLVLWMLGMFPYFTYIAMGKGEYFNAACDATFVWVWVLLETLTSHQSLITQARFDEVNENLDAIGQQANGINKKYSFTVNKRGTRSTP